MVTARRSLLCSSVLHERHHFVQSVIRVSLTDADYRALADLDHAITNLRASFARV